MPVPRCLTEEAPAQPEPFYRRQTQRVPHKHSPDTPEEDYRQNPLVDLQKGVAVSWYVWIKCKTLGCSPHQQEERACSLKRSGSLLPLTFCSEHNLYGNIV